MSLSGDAGLLVMGATDGTVTLWGIEKWKPMKTFFEVHDLVRKVLISVLVLPLHLTSSFPF